MIAAVLKWLYVAEDFRQQGAADALMKELFRVLDKGGVETVICDLPMDEECNLLCAYLEAWGFTFALIDKYEAEVPLESLAEHPVFQNKKEDNVQPLTQVPAYLINQGLQKMSKQQGMLEGIENYLSLCDMEVSCAVIEQGEIKGLTLIRQLSEKKLEILASRSLSAKSENMINMIRFAEKKAYEKYSADTLVRIVCRIGATADLINYFFPDLMPPLMRRGVYTTGEEEE